VFRTRHALTVATAVVPAMLALALPASAGATHTVTIRVVSVTTLQRSTDTPPRGAINKGDVVRIHDHLLSTDRTFATPPGAVVGTDRETIHLLGKRAGTFTGTSILPGGTLRVSGRYDARHMTARVTGGTGYYAHATGTLTIGTKANGVPVPNTYRLQLPGRRMALPAFGVTTI
jgi:hypothetical protein